MPNFSVSQFFLRCGQRERAWRSAGLIERKVQFRPNGANAFSVELT